MNMTKSIRKFLPALILIHFMSLLAVAPPIHSTPGMKNNSEKTQGAQVLRTHVRVLVEEKQALMRLKIDGDYSIKALPSTREMKKGRGIHLPITATQRGVKIGDQEWLVQGFRIEPSDDRDLYLDGRRFRGNMDILKDATAGPLIAINNVNIEDYLYGVLPHEVAHWWPTEALKAQAIAARTYALYQSKVSASQLFDVRSNTFSQVYGGSTVERFRANQAVDATKGMVLNYQSEIFPAYFHASCGGKTAAAKELWKIDLVPLRGSVACRYCWFSPHYDWSTKIPLAELEEITKKNGRILGQILKIEAVTQTPSGRVGSLRISGNLGEAVLAAKDFRVWVGGNRIRSAFFSARVYDDIAEFHGRGWGHGVGLCQWGTLGQALIGRNHRDILKFYYPESVIKEEKEN